MEANKGIYFKLAIVVFSILLLGSFWLTMRAASEPVSMVVIPEVAREGEPILVTFKLNNPSSEPLLTQYQLFADGKLIMKGTSTLTPLSSETNQYAYKNPLEMGQQVNFLVRASSPLGDYERVISNPPYPPQIWSSFVSLASISTTVMSSITTIVYYNDAFGKDFGFNVGILCSAVLILLLIFLEMTGATSIKTSFAILGRLQLRLSFVTWILLIIFMGIVYTKIVMIITTGSFR